MKSVGWNPTSAASAPQVSADVDLIRLQTNYAATAGVSAVTNPSIVFGDFPFSNGILQFGFMVKSNTVNYSGDGSNYFNLTITSCSGTQTGLAGTSIATWSGQSKGLTAGVSVPLTSSVSFPYTVVSGSSLYANWSKTGSVSTPFIFIVGQ